MRDVTTLPPLPADENVKYGEDPNQRIDLWYSKTADSRATVMFIHGGFWRAKYDSAHASFACAALAGIGFNVANVEYRRVGNAGGGWPGTFNDIVAAEQELAQLFTGTAVIVCGHSAGGHLALRLGCESTSLAGVVALAPVAVLRECYELHLSNDAVVEFMGGTPLERSREYDLACPSMHPLKVPAIVVHGTEDDVVPVSISRNYMESRRNGSAHLIELPAMGHMELIDPESAAFKTVASSIADLLR